MIRYRERDLLIVGVVSGIVGAMLPTAILLHAIPRHVSLENMGLLRLMPWVGAALGVAVGGTWTWLKSFLPGKWADAYEDARLVE